MREEKMTILKMVEDGKITADEACKLMEAVSAGGGSTLAAVKEKLASIAKDAKPVAKKAAGVAKEVSGIAAGAAKKSMDIIGSKITEIKNKPRKADFEGDVVVEPVHEEGAEPEDITDKVEIVEDKVEEVKDKAEDIAEEVKDKAEDIAEEVKDKAEDIAEEVKDKAKDIAEEVKNKTK